MGLARELYMKTAVGATEGLHSSTGIQEELERFQVVVAEFDDLAAQGLIDILLRHQESQSGKSYVDSLRFRRLQ